jgi:hypothetical protein
MKKIGNIEILPTIVASETLLNRSSSANVIRFFYAAYSLLYVALESQDGDPVPHIDADSIKAHLAELLNQLSDTELQNLRRIGIDGNQVNADQWSKAKESKALMIVLWEFPYFTDCLLNIHPLASIAIKSFEVLNGTEISTANFIKAKQWLDSINRQRWSRAQTMSEQQSGVSNLGTSSELLLEKAFTTKLDDCNFFKTTSHKIQSYGDFVLMCLPNNLWLSVKSNFARERLLASGYTTDIIGVGFFTSKEEFTSKSKIRNLQRVGFLAMYLPNIPISDEQIQNNLNTYDEVMEYYNSAGNNPPLNINGSPFIRSLNNLDADMGRLLAETNIAMRTTLDF